MNRRDFIKLSAVVAAALPAGQRLAGSESAGPPAAEPKARRAYGGPYEGDHLSRVAFPLGGIGAGMICLEGTGALSHCSLRNHPDVFNEPGLFAAVAVRSPRQTARVVEGPVPGWKLFGPPGSAFGQACPTLGLPRFRRASFEARFPFGRVSLSDPDLPLSARIEGWSPFEPGNADDSSLPVAALEYEFTNGAAEPVEAVFSFHAPNFLAAQDAPGDIRPIAGGFVLHGPAGPDRPWDEAALAAAVDDPSVRVDHAWFRGGWWDPLTLVWRAVAEGACFDRPPVEGPPAAPGASLFVPFRLEPGASRAIRLRLAWYAPRTDLREGRDPPGTAGPNPATYAPWYAGRFSGLEEVASYWESNYGALRERTERFSACLHDSTLPPEVNEAVAANLSILKSPTVLRQTDGRLWGWEGCGDDRGLGDMCSHVWDYAQAVPHLFPALERSMRETEFGPSQDATGQQTFRAGLPIRPIVHVEFDAADGQLGGIMRVHREWRISGDTGWLRGLWPRVRLSLDHCIATWDPRRRGWLEEPQHNTYDIEFWGPNGMGTSIYLGALRAATEMGRALGDDVSGYAGLLESGVRRLERELFDGEYFAQRVEWRGLNARLPTERNAGDSEPFSPEARALMESEGPFYQYGAGCLSDGVIGAWLAEVCGVGSPLDPAKVESHLRAVHRHNFNPDLSSHANPQRPTYADGAEGGLLLCTWPKGGRPTLPFVYCDEVWTGIEYQVASHLMLNGRIAEGLEIVRACRDRYDGRIRNPFDEYEWGHWYARAMSSYALLQGLSGARYDAVDRVLRLKPSLAGDFRCFLCTASGYGTVGVEGGRPFLRVAAGTIDVRRIEYAPRGA